MYSGRELSHPFGIAQYQNSIFWTEYMNASIFQLDLVSGEVSLLRSERPPLFGLRVYDAQSQLGKVTLTKEKLQDDTFFIFFQYFDE